MADKGINALLALSNGERTNKPRWLRPTARWPASVLWLRSDCREVFVGTLAFASLRNRDAVRSSVARPSRLP